MSWHPIDYFNSLPLSYKFRHLSRGLFLLKDLVLQEKQNKFQSLLGIGLLS
ncbi:hypothetical protein HKBW3C_00896, partial [Candidatus Hakubella thermalkaliphila]